MNNKRNFNLKELYLLIYGIVIINYIYFSSTWTQNHQRVWYSYPNRIMLIAGCLLLIISLLMGISYRGIIWLFSMSILIGMVYVFDGNKGLIPLLFMMLSVFIINPAELVKTYVKYSLIGAGMVVISAVSGYIPRSGHIFNNGTWYMAVWGFQNPNFLGYLIVSIALCLLYLDNIESKKLLFMVQFLAILVIHFYLDYDTGTMGLILGWGIKYIISNKRTLMLIRNKIILIIFCALPIVFEIIQVRVAQLYQTNVWLVAHNDFFHWRPAIWSYYWINYPVKVFGQAFEIIKSGFNITVGSGAFDGMYIYTLLSWGLILNFLLILYFDYVIVSAYKKEQFNILVIILPVIVMSFFENGFLSVAASPLLLLAGSFYVNRRKDNY